MRKRKRKGKKKKRRKKRGYEIGNTEKEERRVERTMKRGRK